MQPLAERYRWEAEWPDGSVRTTGGDLVGAVRVSLLPQVPHLPRHDLAGLGFERRFLRAFEKMPLGGAPVLPCWLLWTDGSDVLTVPEGLNKPGHAPAADLRALIRPGQMIRRRNDQDPWFVVTAVDAGWVRLHKPFAGKTKALPTQCKDVPTGREAVHCVVMDHARVYVRCTTGAIMLTPPDYELYL